MKSAKYSLLTLFLANALSGFVVSAEPLPREARLRDIELARVVVERLVNNRELSGFSPSRLKQIPGFLVEEEVDAGGEKILKGRVESRLIEAISLGIGEAKDPQWAAQLLSIDFAAGETGNRTFFLKDCFSTQDLRRLMSPEWKQAVSSHHMRFDFQRDDGSHQYMLRTNPPYDDGSRTGIGACLKSISIFYLYN